MTHRRHSGPHAALAAQHLAAFFCHFQSSAPSHSTSLTPVDDPSAPLHRRRFSSSPLSSAAQPSPSRCASPIALARLSLQPFVVSSRQPPSLHRTTTSRRAHAPTRPRLLRSSPRPVSSSRAQRPQPAFDHSAHSRSCTRHHFVAKLFLRVTCTTSELAKVKHRLSCFCSRLRPRRASPSAAPPRPTGPSPSEGPTYVKFHLPVILPVVVRSCSCSFSCFSRDPSISGPRRWPSATQR